MRIISRKTLREFWTSHPQAQQPLRAWFAETKKACWKGPADIKAKFRTASFVGNDRVVFNIGGNDYTMVVAIKYTFSIVYIRFVGTHAQYDKIDVATV